MFEENENVVTHLTDYFIQNGLNAEVAHFLSMAGSIILLILLLILIHYVSKRIVIKAFVAFTNKTKTTFDDYLVNSNFPRWVSQILPLLIVIATVPTILSGFERFLSIFNTIINIYVIILSVLIIRSILRTSKNYLKTREEFMDKPIESYIQVMMIFLWAIGFIFIFSEISGRSVLNFLISLGAASAIILLIFKDTILGFVASIQVSVNDIVRIGDWITFSKYGADGFVTEINLATVRVQNWDKTFTTIPTYNLIADSFQNWRGMQESPGRRIKRSLYIKQNSIRFITSEDIQKFEKFRLIAPYIKERQKEIEEFNTKHSFDRSSVINGRNQTNLGVFRKYVDTYLRTHPNVSKELTIMVRHLAPTTEGIPLEIYCFSSEKAWEVYEQITADIFDHLIAAIPYFDLQLFESPSGDDIIKSVNAMNSNRFTFTPETKKEA